MRLAQEIRRSLLHFVFPQICPGCGDELFGRESSICPRCLFALPETRFEYYPDNPVERKFWGRLPIHSAFAQYYFGGDSLVKRLMHQFKYRGHLELGLQLGRMMGNCLHRSARFYPDALVALPLHPGKEKKRGFNQAAVLCEGISATTRLPVLKNVVQRGSFTETQTRKGRIDRWLNMEGKFVLQDPEAVRNRHLLLVDDVVTTGATLEACGSELLKAEGVELSIATLCYASQ